MNVYVADISGQGVTSMPGLQRTNGGKRAIRARYPNADTELAQFPEGWILSAQKWLPAKKYPDAVTITVNTPQREDIVMFQQYR